MKPYIINLFNFHSILNLNKNFMPTYLFGPRHYTYILTKEEVTILKLKYDLAIHTYDMCYDVILLIPEGLDLSSIKCYYKDLSNTFNDLRPVI